MTMAAVWTKAQSLVLLFLVFENQDTFCFVGLCFLIDFIGHSLVTSLVSIWVNNLLYNLTKYIIAISKMRQILELLSTSF